MTEVASAYVSLVPSAKGFARGIQSEIGGTADKTGRDYGDGFDRGMKSKAGGIVAGFSRALGPIGVLVGAAGGAVAANFLADAIGGAADLNETVSKSGQIFGDSLKDVRAWAKDSEKNILLTERAALDAASTFGILGRAGGLTGEELSGFSTNLTGLSSDLASFNNTSPEEAVEAIGSALRGEAEPLRRYGVLLDDATLRARAFAEGITDSDKQALTPAQKTLAAYKEILAQTSTQQGDAERTSGSYANQQKILAKRMDELKTSIGEKLLPVAERFVTWLADDGIDALYRFGGWLEDNKESIKNFAFVAADAGLIVAEGFLRMSQFAATALQGAAGSCQLFLRFFFGWGDHILATAEAAFGWIPGIGDKIGGARDRFAELGRTADEKLTGVQTALRWTADKAGEAADGVAGIRANLNALENKTVTVDVRYLSSGLIPSQADRLAGARAGGGPVDGRKPYLIGERGPEIFVPDSSGHVIPNHQIGRSSGPSGGPAVINLFDADGVLMGTMRGAVDQRLDDVARGVSTGTWG